MHVFPIGIAESLAQQKAKEWMLTPKKNGEARSPNFPVSYHKDDQILKLYSDAWELLELPSL